MKSRRTFLQETMLAGAGSLILPGFVKFTGRKPKLKNVGVQLYSVRTEMMADAVAL